MKSFLTAVLLSFFVAMFFLNGCVDSSGAGFASTRNLAKTQSLENHALTPGNASGSELAKPQVSVKKTAEPTPVFENRFTKTPLFFNSLLEREKKTSGYIVQLKEKPVLETRGMELQNLLDQQAPPGIDKEPPTEQELEQKIESRILAQKQKISTEHSAFRQQLSVLLPQAKIGKEFKNNFNGFALQAAPNQINEITALPQVKNVFPNLEVKTFLEESVPLTKADAVWSLNKYGVSCNSPPSTYCELADINEDGNANSDDIQAIVTAFSNPFDPKFDVDPNGAITINDIFTVLNWISLCNETALPPACLTGNGIRIGIIDTGVDYNHPDLGGCFGPGCKVEGGYDFGDNDNDPMDKVGHGTHVASIAAGNGTLKGLAPDAKIFAYKVWSDNSGTSFLDKVLDALERTVDPNMDGKFFDRLNVVNMSIGFEDIVASPTDPLAIAVDNAVQNGVVVVVSAGNSGPQKSSISSPGVSQKAITVGASYKKNYAEFGQDTNTVTGQPSFFSSRGPVKWVDNSGQEQVMIKPDILAPGAIICAARHDNIFPPGTHQYYFPCIDEQHVQIAGTSMSSPEVAGIAALLLSAKPVTPQKVKEIIKNTGVTAGKEPFIEGNGNIDALAALNYLLKGARTIEMVVDKKIAGTIDIKGKIEIPNFSSYKIFFSPAIENPLWTQILSANSLPASSSASTLLGTFDSSGLPQGFYYFKLEVTDTTGQVFHTIALSEKTSEFEITSPKNLQSLQTTTPIQIKLSAPTVLLQGNNYTVQFRGGANPLEWSNQGITLAGQSGDTIAEWNASQLTAGKYLLKVTVNTLEGEIQKLVTVFLDCGGADPNENQLISNSVGWNVFADTFGKKIAFTHIENIFNLSEKDLVLYDTDTKQFTTIPSDPVINFSATDNEQIEVFPSVYENKVAWIDERTTGEGSGIYLYDALTGQQQKIVFAIPSSIAMHENKIVWSDNSERIIMLDIATNQYTYINITTNSTKKQLDMFEDKIVWADNRNGSYDIVLYNTTTGQEQVINQPGNDISPKIFGNTIVFAGNKNGNYDIFVYDIASQSPVQLTNYPENELNPSIYKDMIVWEKNFPANGIPFGDIFMHDLSTGQEFKLSKSNYHQESYPAIHEKGVAWMALDPFNITIDIGFQKTGGNCTTCPNNVCEFGENNSFCPGDCNATHGVCQEFACTITQGAGANECLTGASCSHTQCINSACTLVAGAGQNQCSFDSECSHTVCENNSCTIQTGPGVNACSTNDDCLLGTVNFTSQPSGATVKNNNTLEVWGITPFSKQLAAGNYVAIAQSNDPLYTSPITENFTAITNTQTDVNIIIPQTRHFLCIQIEEPYQGLVCSMGLGPGPTQCPQECNENPLLPQNTPSNQ